MKLLIYYRVVILLQIPMIVFVFLKLGTSDAPSTVLYLKNL